MALVLDNSFKKILDLLSLQNNFYSGSIIPEHNRIAQLEPPVPDQAWKLFREVGKIIQHLLLELSFYLKIFNTKGPMRELGFLSLAEFFVELILALLTFLFFVFFLAENHRARLIEGRLK